MTQTMNRDPFNTLSTLETPLGNARYYRLSALETQGLGDISRLPFSIKVMLEQALRQCDEFTITSDDARRLARWLDGRGWPADLTARALARAADRGRLPSTREVRR